MQETWVRPLGWEDLMKKEMATHSNILGYLANLVWTYFILKCRLCRVMGKQVRTLLYF